MYIYIYIYIHVYIYIYIEREREIIIYIYIYSFVRIPLSGDDEPQQIIIVSRSDRLWQISEVVCIVNVIQGILSQPSLQPAS